MEESEVVPSLSSLSTKEKVGRGCEVTKKTTPIEALRDGNTDGVTAMIADGTDVNQLDKVKIINCNESPF